MPLQIYPSSDIPDLYTIEARCDRCRNRTLNFSVQGELLGATAPSELIRGIERTLRGSGWEVNIQGNYATCSFCREEGRPIAVSIDGETIGLLRGIKMKDRKIEPVPPKSRYERLTDEDEPV